MSDQVRKLKKVHMPENSLFFEKVVPILLVLLGLITVSLIVFALSLLVGTVHL